MRDLPGHRAGLPLRSSGSSLSTLRTFGDVTYHQLMCHNINTLLNRTRLLGIGPGNLPQQSALPQCLDRRLHQLDVQLHYRPYHQGYARRDAVWYLYLRHIQCSGWPVHMEVFP
jgi:hypothetical protein